MLHLSAFAADCVERFYIDCLDKLSEGMGRQLRKGAVPLYPLNKPLYILCLLFLFMDLLLGPMVSKWSLMAIYRTPYWGNV